MGRKILDRCTTAALATLLAAAAALAGLATQSAYAAGTWTPESVGTGYGYNLDSVTFVDASRGWTVSDSGDIFATSDGGAHWTAQSSGTRNMLLSVHFVSAAHGWVVGERGTILATTDGGTHWTTQTWTTPYELDSVTFTDDNHGWAVGGGGTILVTTNGGTQWTAQKSNTGSALDSVTFTDATHGWAVGWDGTIVATTDGGAHWTPQASGSAGILHSVFFIDTIHGWAVGDNGTVIATTDGGAHWTAQHPGTGEDLYGLAFPDATHGWAVGSEGTIVSTTDGGAHWTAQTWGTGDDLQFLNSVAFTDATHGWAAGQAGTILAFKGAAPATPADRYEPDNTLGTAKSIGVSADVASTGLQMHTFHTNKDVDYVKMSVTKGSTYVMKVLGSDKTNKNRWLDVAIYRYDKTTKKWYQVGKEVATNGYLGSVTFKAVASTTYAVRIRPYTASGSGTVYGLRVTSAYPAVKPDAYEPTDNTLGGSTVLAPHPYDGTSMDDSGVYAYGIYGDCQLHSISTTSDGDWYSITMSPGHVYSLEFCMGDRGSYTRKVDYCNSYGDPVFPTVTYAGEYSYETFSGITTATKYYFHVHGDGKNRFWYRIGLFDTP